MDGWLPNSLKVKAILGKKKKLAIEFRTMIRNVATLKLHLSILFCYKGPLTVYGHGLRV